MPVWSAQAPLRTATSGPTRWTSCGESPRLAPRCAIGIRSTHYASMGFGEKLSVDVAEGLITKPDLVESKHVLGTDKQTWITCRRQSALIVVCQVER